MVDVAEEDLEAAAFRAHALDIVGSWSVHDDDDGRLFYYNLESRESRWRVPDELSALESAFMMKLMLDGALARSGAWTVHDSGDGTLYYFNEKTRESMWERPEEWGAENVVAGNGQASVPPPPPAPPGQGKKPEPVAEKEKETAKKKEGKSKKEKKKKEAAVEKDEEEASALPSAEELEVLRQRAEEAQRSRESFCEMLRDKKIMPFCKWSVAFPQIVADPRFLAVATMDERQEIFEDFVAKLPSDLKSEKKQKLKDAKKKFSKVLREQFKQQRERGAFDEKLTLSVFLATLEDNIPAEQHKTLQQDVLAFLPLAVQEKLWQREMTDFLEATKAGREQETRLRAFLLEKLSGRGAFVSWHDGAVQDALKAFFAAEGDTKISEAIQQGIVGQVVKTLSIQAQAGEHHHTRPLGPRSKPREDGHYRPVDVTERKDGSTHAAASNERRGRDVRGRHRSESRDRGNKSGGRDSVSRGRPGRSSSRSSSRSRSRSRGRRNDRDRDRSYDRQSSRRERRSRRSRSSSRSRSGSRSPSRDRGRHRH